MDMSAAWPTFACRGSTGERLTSVNVTTATATIKSRNRPSCDTTYLAMAQPHYSRSSELWAVLTKRVPQMASKAQRVREKAIMSPSIPARTV